MNFNGSSFNHTVDVNKEPLVLRVYCTLCPDKQANKIKKVTLILFRRTIHRELRNMFLLNIHFTNLFSSFLFAISMHIDSHKNKHKHTSAVIITLFHTHAHTHTQVPVKNLAGGHAI